MKVASILRNYLCMFAGQQQNEWKQMVIPHLFPTLFSRS